MRDLPVSAVTKAVKNLFMDANWHLGEDVLERLKECLRTEESDLGREMLQMIIRNAQIAHENRMPICQDTGFAVLFAEVGQDVHFTGGNFTDAINEGVRQGYQEGFLRKSVVRDPIERENTMDNTPAVLYTELVPGDRVKITVVPKGGGSENMSTIKMMIPTAGIEEIKNFVVGCVKEAGGNPCPPIIVGVGIGGTFEKCAQIAKKALLRPIGSRHPNSIYSRLEEELLQAINDLGIGPQGFGGRCTALDVFVETFPCHIASFPVAVNLQCHAARHKEIII